MADIESIKDLIPDDMNFNMGTAEGQKMMDRSVGRFGLGRSIVVDKDNRILAGNKTYEAALRAGVERVIVVETQGDELVAVKRTDLDLDTREGREMALADNVTANVNLDIDYDKINEVMNQVELHPEIWDVRLKDESTGGLMRNAGGKNETLSVDSVKFCGFDIVLTEEEANALRMKILEYSKQNGTLDNFVSTIIQEYNDEQDD